MRSLNPANMELTNKVVLPKNGRLDVTDDIGIGIEWSEKGSGQRRPDYLEISPLHRKKSKYKEEDYENHKR